MVDSSRLPLRQLPFAHFTRGGCYAAWSRAGTPDKPFRAALTLSTGKNLLIDQTTTIGSGGTLTLSGGALTTKSLLINSGGAFNFSTGSLRFTQSQIVDPTFASAVHLDSGLTAGRHFQVDGTATLNTQVSVAGGSFTADSIINANNLVLRGGTLNIRLGALTVPSGSYVDVGRGTTVNAGGGLNIGAGGEFTAIGATLNATGPSTNSGQISAISSTLNFPNGLGGTGPLYLINTILNVSASPIGAASISSAGDNFLSAPVSGSDVDVSSGALTLLANSGPSFFDTLSISSGATLNLTNNSLAIKSASLAEITDDIRAGLSNSGGLIAAISNPAHRLAAISNGTPGSPLYFDFEGIPNLTGGEILLRRTVIGDLNLDGVVTIADFIALASHFNSTQATWGDGDVNYDHQVTIADFVDLAANFNSAYSSISSPIDLKDAALLSNFAAASVPEPLWAISLLSLSLLLFRSRSKNC